MACTMTPAASQVKDNDNNDGYGNGYDGNVENGNNDCSCIDNCRTAGNDKEGSGLCNQQPTTGHGAKRRRILQWQQRRQRQRQGGAMAACWGAAEGGGQGAVVKGVVR